MHYAEVVEGRWWFGITCRKTAQQYCIDKLKVTILYCTQWSVWNDRNQSSPSLLIGPKRPKSTWAECHDLSKMRTNYTPLAPSYMSKRTLNYCLSNNLSIYVGTASDLPSVSLNIYAWNDIKLKLRGGRRSFLEWTTEIHWATDWIECQLKWQIVIDLLKSKVSGCTETGLANSIYCDCTPKRPVEVLQHDTIGRIKRWNMRPRPMQVYKLWLHRVRTCTKDINWSNSSFWE